MACITTCGNDSDSKYLAYQIHHTSRDHLVVRDETDSSCMFDRLGFERPARFIMTPSLSIPLGLMYGKIQTRT